MTKRSDRRTEHPKDRASRALTRYLLHAVGVGLAASALGAGACGGKVFVDLDDDTAGSGGSGGSSNDTSSSGTGEFTCEADTVYSLEYACLASPPSSSGCPAASAPSVFNELLEVLGEQGCGGADLSSVPCGPDPTVTGQCCYFADAIVYECGGRPFVVGGSPITALLASGSGWSRGDAPQVAALDATTRQALADAWAKAALDEHASVASFARFTLELLASGAPADLVALAQRATGDEIRHAELCFALASAYAGGDVRPGPLAIDGAIRPGSTLAQIAAAAVREGCIGETLAACEAAAARDAAVDPAVRAALSAIARDEAEHAALAFRFVAWARGQGDPEVVRAIEAAFAEGIAATPPLSGELAGDPEALRAHGRLAPLERQAAAIRCLADVVAPCAAVLLGRRTQASPGSGQRAWGAR